MFELPDWRYEILTRSPGLMMSTIVGGGVRSTRSLGRAPLPTYRVDPMIAKVMFTPSRSMTISDLLTVLATPVIVRRLARSGEAFCAPAGAFARAVTTTSESQELTRMVDERPIFAGFTD